MNRKLNNVAYNVIKIKSTMPIIIKQKAVMRLSGWKVNYKISFSKCKIIVLRKIISTMLLRYGFRLQFVAQQGDLGFSSVP